MAAPLPDDAVAYLRDKRVPDLLERLLRELVAARPARPAAFLRDVLARPAAPQLLIAGPPAGGKGTQCEAIEERYGVVHISTGDLLRAEVKAGTPEGRRADQCMQAGELVPDDAIITMVRGRLAQPDCRERGWLLDGFPRTKAQAEALREAGVVPHCMVLLEVPDEVVIGRVEGRRTDPATGHVYHVTFNPPPADDEALLRRLEHRKDDTREAMAHRLETYHGHVAEIAEVFDAVTVRVDGNRPRDAIAADVLAGIQRMLPE